RRRFLEHGRRRPVWIHDQSADRALLHARAEHNAPARTRGAVRRLWNARHRPDADLSSRAHSWRGVERRALAVFLLGAQWRTASDVRAQFIARGSSANLGVCRARLLVRPEFGILADPGSAESALAANSRRHAICTWCGHASPIYRGP